METLCHSFIFSIEEEATIKKIHNQTNASMVSVALIETEEKMKVSNLSI
jgi:hypothetical protein